MAMTSTVEKNASSNYTQGGSKIARAIGTTVVTILKRYTITTVPNDSLKTPKDAGRIPVIT